MDASDDTPRGRLVGRDGELAALDAALTGALAGRQEVVLLAGDAGIGKTSLARWVADEARARGAEVAWGAGWDGGGAPAFWAWVQVVRALARGRAPGDLRAELGAGARWLAALVPELRGLPDMGDPPATEPEQARFRVFEALSLFLGARSARAPLAVIVDDLHWTDDPTVRALEFLGRTLHGAPLLLLGTYRDSEAAGRQELAPALASLGRTARHVPVPGLTEAAVAELVAAYADGAAAPSLARAVHDVSGGNPLFADELLRLLASEGALAADAAGPHALPRGVADAIRRRLAPLPAEAVRLLTVAAVIGGEFRLATLAAAAGAPIETAMAAVDAGVRAGVLAVDPDGTPRRARFTHALVRETLLSGLQPGSRGALHADVARALEERYGAGAEEHLPELAFHVLEAVPHIPAERALRYAVDAGHHALAHFDHTEAVRLFERAVDLRDVLGPDDERDAGLLCALGAARIRAGDVPGGREALAGAAAAARRLGDPLRLAEAALTSAPWGFSPGVVEEDVVALLAEAVGVLDDAGGNVQVDALRAQLRARLAGALYWSPDVARRRRLVAEATGLARSLRDRVRPEDVATADATLAHVLGQAFTATWGPDTTEEGLAISDELLELCRATGDAERELNTRSWRISLLCELDDLPAARHEAGAYAELAGRLRQPRTEFYVPLHQGMVALLEGRFAEVEAHALRAGQLGREMPGTLAPLLAAAQLGVLRLEQGRGAEIEGAIRAFAARHPAMPAWRAGLVIVLLQSGRPAEARDEYERLAARDFTDLHRDNLWLAATWWLGHAAAEFGDAPRARILHGLLAPFAARNALSPEAAVLGPVARVLAALAHAIGEPELALEHLAAARLAAARQGARPTLAHVALLEARVRAAADPLRARALAVEAAARAEALGLAAPAAEARALLERLDEAPAPARFARRDTARPALLRREGEVWTVGLDGAVFHLRDAKGLVHLAQLLARPGEPVHALDLVAVAEGAGRGMGAGDAVAAGLDVRAGGRDAPGPALDDEAKRSYRTRVAELREELEEAESFNDPERAARAREELGWLAGQLSAAVGLGGRDRRTGSDAERARVNVTRAIRTVLRRIGERDAELGRILQRTVRTGTSCVYVPDDAAPLDWELAAAAPGVAASAARVQP